MTTDGVDQERTGAGAIPGGRRIVVGVDGSPGSRAALAWALEEARAHGAEVYAVTVWHFTDNWAYPLPDVTDAELSAEAGKRLEAAVSAVLAEQAGAAPVQVHRQVFEGHPASTLVQAAKGADLLVVGSRGHGGFTGLLLGSVSQQIVHHAPCPAVVVPAPHPHRA